MPNSSTRIALCNSPDLIEGGRAVPFDVVYAGQTCRAFAIRFEGQPHAYLNRCTHVAMEWTFSQTNFLMQLGAGYSALRMVLSIRPIRGSASEGLVAVVW